MTKLSVGQLVKDALAVLAPREKEVVEKRRGLRDGRELTLAEIGDSFGVTRERVRQIEDGAFNKLVSFAKKGELNGFFGTVENHLKAVGGLRKENLLVEDLKYLLRDATNSEVLGNQIKFLLDLSTAVGYSPEDGVYHSYWFASKDDRKKATNFVGQLTKFLEKKKAALVNQPLGVQDAFKEVVKAYSLKDNIALNYIALSKLFHINQFGDFGLAGWSEVNPKTVRHWAYLVLKKDRKPLHFSDIAVRINQVKKSSKSVNAQTVHNELIKDERFVLVGRGTYGLREFGLTPGTARQVISRLLKQHGPLKPRDVADLIKKERVFKDNTIFINLQNKKHFNRLSDGRYTVREA